VIAVATSSPPTVAKAHVFVDDLAAPRLASDDHHHLARVLRLAAGAQVTAADGRGRWRSCRLGNGPDLDVTGEVVVEPRPTPTLTVAFALVKGERPELVVQKLTELGVDRIVPFAAERSVVRWESTRYLRQMARLASIARQAAMQCRRSWLPEVGLPGDESDAAPRPADFAAVASLPNAAMADRAGRALSLVTPTLLVGPEGGWSTTERAAGLPLVRLGEHVLRAETAALTAGALLGALRSRLVA
jgi:16S rRNA (uracil1498-N3)-methyltransferase